MSDRRSNGDGSPTYDCTADVLAHKARVKDLMSGIVSELAERAYLHDVSKLEEPEKSVFDQATPILAAAEFGSPEYTQALAAMGEGLQHHYAANRHHPEHFENGIHGMTLLDILEMVVDWKAAAERRGAELNLAHLSDRFRISDQLSIIIHNTLREMGD